MKDKLTPAARARKRALALIKNEEISQAVFTKEERVPKKLKLITPIGSGTIDKTAHKGKEDTLGWSYAAIVNNPFLENAGFDVPHGRPMWDDPQDIVACKHCRKSIIRQLSHSHIKNCLRDKAERKRLRKQAKEQGTQADTGKDKKGAVSTSGDKDSEDLDGSNDKGVDKPNSKVTAKESATSKADGASAPTGKPKPGGTKKKAEAEEDKADGKNSKKRKATDDDKSKEKEGPKTKKTKKEKAAPKPKGPVDVERQCGVPLDNGLLCARSLTCKSHSMGAKRAVQGRPAPYDTLLAAYQKKNQAKQQKAAINASNPAPDDMEANSHHVDSDEEMEFVMAAVARSNPQPAVHTILLSARQKYQHRRFALMLGAALKPPNPPMSAVDGRHFSGFSFMGAA